LYELVEAVFSFSSETSISFSYLDGTELDKRGILTVEQKVTVVVELILGNVKQSVEFVNGFVGHRVGFNTYIFSFF
jgi:hypothetical protein